MKKSNLWNLLRQTFKEWSEDKAQRLAAALSYYTVFSIPPVLVIVISVAGIFLNRAQVQQALLGQISGLLTPQAAEAIGGMIDSVHTTGQGWLATVIGLAVLLLGASGFFSQLQDALNTIWEVRPKTGLGIKVYIQKRILSFVMILALGFLLLVSLVLTTALAAVSQYVQSWLPQSRLLFQWINFLLPFIVITFLFALMYRYIPDAEIGWRDVWLGAVITALLFILGEYLLALYLARSHLTTTFGAAASVALIFVWVYYTAQILLLGAEFTQVYATLFGSGVQPEPHAERVTEHERVQQGIPRK